MVGMIFKRTGWLQNRSSTRDERALIVIRSFQSSIINQSEYNKCEDKKEDTQSILQALTMQKIRFYLIPMNKHMVALLLQNIMFRKKILVRIKLRIYH